MKSKSIFKKILLSILPFAAIGVITPVVMTACGTSTKNGGSTEETETVKASWNTTVPSSVTGLTVTSDLATVTLSSTNFNNTGISSLSTENQIKTSLTPPSSEAKAVDVTTENASSSKTLYQLLANQINNVDKFDVKMTLNTPNLSNFDFSDSDVNNGISGQFTLTPKQSSTDESKPATIDESSTESDNTTVLKFQINNYNDASTTAKTASGDTVSINATKLGTALRTGTMANGLQDFTPTVGQGYANIDYSKPTSTNNNLSTVLDKLKYKNITTSNLSSFIDIKTADNKDATDKATLLSEATVSDWAPSQDGTSVFTRIVIPTTSSAATLTASDSEDTSSPIVLYIAYTGLTADGGCAWWNDNIGLYGEGNVAESKDKSNEEPVIDLNDVSSDFTEKTGISKTSTSEQIVAKKAKLVDYMKNYIVWSDKFNASSEEETIKTGTMNTSNYLFTADASTKPSVNNVTLASTDTKATSTTTKAAIKVQFVLRPKTATVDNERYTRNFYLINFGQSKES